MRHKGNDKWGRRPISPYLAWLACKLVWCADHLALYPRRNQGRKKQDWRILRQCWKHLLDLKALIDSTRAFKSVLQTAEESTLCSWSSLFLRFFLTYWRSLRASDSRSTPVTLHAPWSGCARWALNARLTSIALWTPISIFTWVTDLSRTQGSVPGGYYKVALVFSTLTDWNTR